MGRHCIARPGRRHARVRHASRHTAVLGGTGGRSGWAPLVSIRRPLACSSATGHVRGQPPGGTDTARHGPLLDVPAFVRRIDGSQQRRDATSPRGGVFLGDPTSARLMVVDRWRAAQLDGGARQGEVRHDDRPGRGEQSHVEDDRPAARGQALADAGGARCGSCTANKLGTMAALGQRLKRASLAPRGRLVANVARPVWPLPGERPAAAHPCRSMWPPWFSLISARRRLSLPPPPCCLLCCSASPHPIPSHPIHAHPCPSMPCPALASLPPWPA